MNKFYYKLIAKGHKSKVMIAKNLVDCKDIFGKETIDSLFYSDHKYVYANNEETARIKIREKLTNVKWQGFTLMNVGVH
jgi:hypothetical protein